MITKSRKRIVPYNVYAPIRDGLRYLRSFRYAGGRYECPLCKGRFSTFRSTGQRATVLADRQVVGAGYRQNAKCPRCRCDDRERLVYLFLTRRAGDLLARGIRLLHVAPEKRLCTWLRSHPNIDYVSVDLDSPLAQMQMDITDITFADNSFELIICNHVLEHIPDDAQAMRELFRVLKPGGLAILQVPISYAIDSTYEDFTIVDSEARLAAFGQRDHVRIYGPDYPQRLGRAGFAVKAHPVTEMFRDDEVDQFRLLINERLFECRKPEPS